MSIEDFEGVKNIPGIKSAKKRVLVTKIKNEKGEIITSRKGIANVFGESYKKIHDDTQRSRQKSCELQSTNSQKANPQTATESEQKTSKLAVKRREKW